MAKKEEKVVNKEDPNQKLTFDTLTEQTMKVKVSEIAPLEMRANTLTITEINNIIDTLAINHGIEKVSAFCAIILLFLKGAANNGAPNTMSVDVVDSISGPTTISKYDIKYAYQRVTHNEFIRRLAESLAMEIGKYAEKNFLSGDIASKIDSRIMASKEESERIPLSARERAWASSFSQRLPNLSDLSSSRLPQLLAADYNERFSKKSKEKKSSPGKNTVPEKKQKQDKKVIKGEKK